MTAYEIGRALEYRVADYLRELGYFAMRSPASKSKIDVIAVRPHQVLFVQCKRDARLDPDEWNALYMVARACGAIPLLASRPVPRKPIVFEQLMDMKTGGRTQPKRIWLSNGC